MPINTDPIFTNIGINKIANAILTNTHIQLTTIKVGDCINDLNYQHLPTDTDIQHFIANTQVESTHYLDLKGSNHAVLRVKGTIPFDLAADYTIREYGIYDSNNDLIIVGRINDSQLKPAGEIRTELELVVNISISDAQKAFIVNNVPDSDYVSKNDLTAHIEAINPHGLIKEDFSFNNVTNTSDLDKPTHPYIAQLFYDTKLGVGFANRTSSTITKSGNNIVLTPITDTTVYKRGVKHIISTPVSIDTSVRQNGDLGETYPDGYIGGFYVAYNPTNNSLYIINDNPDFDNDILVAWFYRNRTQGIIWLADERHAASRNTDNHKLHHLEVGATWIDGGLLVATLNDYINNRLSITTPLLLADEDLNFRILDVADPVNPYEQVLTNAELPVLYIDSNGEYVVTNNHDEDLNWLYNGNGAVYNDVNTGLLQNVPSGKYLSYWMLFTNDQVDPVKLLVGRMAHDTIDSAGAEVLTSFGLPMPEIVGAYKIILNINDLNLNAAKAKIESIFEISNSTRKSSIKANSHTLLLGRDTAGQHTINSIKGLAALLADAGKVRNVGLTGTVKADITEVDNNGKITLDTHMSDGRNMVYRDDPVFTDTFGNLGVTTTKWIGAALAPNGKIYCAPVSATQVLEIDPATKTTALIGSVYSDTWKWYGAALAPNGKVYCIPYNATQVLEIDPATKTTTLIGSVYSGTGKWYGAALAPNGKIYCVPRNATQVLEIDPISKTTTLIGSVYSSDASKWSGAALASNGKIYCVPRDATQVLEIDPATKTTALIGSVYSDTGKWLGAVLAPNGRIYCMPASASQVLEIDPATKTTTLIGSVYSDALKWIGAALAPNGKIYCVPYDATQVLEIDPATKTTTLIGSVYSGEYKWVGAALAPNGKIYCVPYGATQILEIDTFPKSTDYQAYLKLPN